MEEEKTKQLPIRPQAQKKDFHKLAAALRENLRKRKMQKRAQEEAEERKE